MNSANRFGEKLRRLRLHHKMTLKKLSEQLGYATHSYINEIELGRKSPTIQLVMMVSQLFDVSIDLLLRDDLDLDVTESTTGKE